jgi:hypothetical protein
MEFQNVFSHLAATITMSLDCSHLHTASSVGIRTKRSRAISVPYAMTCLDIFTVRFEKVIYVLHCFQKKSPSGVQTTKTHERLKVARADCEVRYGKKK